MRIVDWNSFMMRYWMNNGVCHNHKDFIYFQNQKKKNAFSFLRTKDVLQPQIHMISFCFRDEILQKRGVAFMKRLHFLTSIIFTHNFAKSYVLYILCHGLFYRSDIQKTNFTRTQNYTGFIHAIYFGANSSSFVF